MRETTRGRWTSGALILLCAMMSPGCTLLETWIAGDKWRMPRVVKFTGIEGLCNYPPTWCADARGGRPGGILARDGDLFFYKENVLPYRATDGESLVLKAKDDVLLVNGKAVSIRLSGQGWEWLRKASTEDLADLRLLQFGRDADALDFPLLERVAQVRPDIGLALEKDGEPSVAARVISLFEPHFLFIELDVLSKQFDALAPRLAKLEILWTGGKGSLDFLPRLKRLHTLLLLEWEPAGSGVIPGGSRALRSVSLLNDKLDDLSVLRNVTGLQELVLFKPELKDITALAAFPELKKLDLARSRVPDLSVLERLPRLAWLGFPVNTTQDDFARLIASHPGLEVVELSSENVRDLSTLRGLRHLKALILGEKNIDVGLLQDLKNLQYLGLPPKSFSGDAAKQTEALEKALPKTFVAQAGPFCLGSGWILLLVPAIVLLRRLWPRRYGLRSMASA